VLAEGRDQERPVAELEQPGSAINAATAARFASMPSACHANVSAYAEAFWRDVDGRGQAAYVTAARKRHLS
jgi:hypothetical protein